MKRRRIQWFANYKWYKGDPFRMFDVTIGDEMLGDGWMLVNIQIARFSLGFGFWWK